MFEDLLFGVFVFLVALYINSSFSKPKYNNLPPTIKPWRIFGYVPFFLGMNTPENMHNLFKKLSDEHNGLFYMYTYWFLLGHFCIISKPKYLKAVLSKKETRKFEPLYSQITILKNGLITNSGPKWSERHKVAVSIFSTKNLNRIHHIVQKHTVQLVDELKPMANGHNQDLNLVFAKSVFTLVSEALLGFDPEFIIPKIKDIVDVVEENIDLIDFKITHLYLTPVLDKLGLMWPVEKKADRILRPIFYQALENKLEKPDGYDHMTYWDKFASLDKEDLFCELKTLLGAGYESTKTSLNLFLTMMGMFPDHQNRVYEEQLEIFGDSMRPASFEELSHMKYLQACIDETLRLFPVIPLIVKTMVEDEKLSEEYMIPRGTILMIQLSLLHKDPEVWERPEEYYPDHFWNEELCKKRPKFSFLPFGGGPRMCIGMKFSSITIKTMLSQIIRTFHIDSDVKELADIKILRTFISDTRNLELKLHLRH